MPYDFYGSFFEDNSNEPPQQNNEFEDPEDKEFNEFIVRGARRTHSRLFGALAIYIMAAYILTTAFVHGMSFFFKDAYAKLFSTTLGIYLFNAVIMYLICLPIFYLLVRKMETRKLWKRKFSIKEFIEILAISQVLMSIGNYIGLFFNNIVGALLGKEITNTTSVLIESSSVWTMIIFSVILAPIAEEILMRKLLIDRLSKYGSGFALVVSSVAFGLFHGNFYQFFYAAFLGFVLGYLYIRGGLKYSIFLHMIINFIGSVLSSLFIDAINVIATTENIDAVPYSAFFTVVFYSFIIVALLIYGVFLIFRKLKRDEFSFKSLRDARLTIPKKSVAKSVFANVGMILFLIISALSMIDSILL